MKYYDKTRKFDTKGLMFNKIGIDIENIYYWGFCIDCNNLRYLASYSENSLDKTC